MGIPLCNRITCCQKSNVILQTHTLNKSINKSYISNSKSSKNNSKNENESKENINESANISNNKSNYDESKSNPSSNSENNSSNSNDTNNNISENLYKTGILRKDKINETKEDKNYILIDSYNNNNNFFYYLKKVQLIQKYYRIHKEKNKKETKKKSKNIKITFNLIEDKKEKKNLNIEEENNLYFNISKTKLSFANLYTNIKTTGMKVPMVPFNLNSKKNIKYRYYGQLTDKRELSTPEIKTTLSVKNKLLLPQNLNKRRKSDMKIKSGYGRIEYNDKSIFQGTFKNNKAEGIGHYQDDINGNFLGEYKNNEPNGYGIYNNGGIQEEGKFNGNYLNGIGIERSDDDTNYEGEFHLSIKHGIGTFKWSDGTIYQGNFLNNEMTGFGIIEYNDGKLYQGGILNGSMNGYGEFYWKEGKRYYGYYKNDKRNGFGIYIWVIQPLEAYIGFFENGLFNGVGIKISGDNVKYGIWKRQEREKWFKGPWEFENHIRKKENLKYMNIFQMKHFKLFEFILNLTKNEIFYNKKTSEKENIIDINDNISEFTNDNNNNENYDMNNNNKENKMENQINDEIKTKLPHDKNKKVNFHMGNTIKEVIEKEDEDEDEEEEKEEKKIKNNKNV